MQVVRVQHSPHIPGQSDAGTGGSGGRVAHRPRPAPLSPVAGNGGRRADGRRVHAVLRPVLCAVLQQPRLRRAHPGHRPVLLRISQERGQPAPADAVRVPQDEEPFHVHVARGQQRLRARLPEYPDRVHPVLHGSVYLNVIIRWDFPFLVVLKD